MSEATDLTARFQLEQLLNWTGSARTFRGQHPDTGEPVAVKLLSLARTPAAPALARRFETTVDVLRTLRHPALPRILEHGFTPERDAYLVTAWVDGEPLPGAGPVSPSFLLPVLLQVVEALETLSLHGLVHLNLRPENVLATADGRASLVGWGTSLLTVDWQSVVPPGAEGAADYSAPEVRRPHSAADALWRADLYSLAAIATRLLGGLRVSDGDVPPRIQFPRQTSETLHDPEQLRAVLERCLAPDPAVRPDSYVDLARALQHAMPRFVARVAETQPIAALRLAGGVRGLSVQPGPVAFRGPAGVAPAPVIMSSPRSASPSRGFTAMSEDKKAPEAPGADDKPKSSQPPEGEGTRGGYDPDRTMLGIDLDKTMHGFDPSRLESPPPPEKPAETERAKEPSKEPSTNPIDPKGLSEEEAPSAGEGTLPGLDAAETVLGLDPRALGFDPEKTMLGFDPGATLHGIGPAAIPTPAAPATPPPAAADQTTVVPLPVAPPAAPAVPSPQGPTFEKEKVEKGDETVFLARPPHVADPHPPAAPPAGPAQTDRTVVVPVAAAAPPAPAVERTVVMPRPTTPAAAPPVQPPVVDRTVVMPPPAGKPAASAPPPPTPKAAPAPKPAPPKAAAKPAAAPPPAAVPPAAAKPASATAKPASATAKPASATAQPASQPAKPAAPAASMAPAGPASGGRSLAWLWVAIAAVLLLVILGVVAVVAIRVLPGLLGRGEQAEPAVVAEAPPPVVEPATDVPDTQVAELPPELLEARDLLAQGQALQARERLDGIAETVESTEVPVAPEVYDAYRVLRDEILLARRDQVAAAMQDAWSRRNLASLRQVLRGIAPEEEQALLASPDTKRLLDRTRAATRTLARGESTLQGGDPIAALVMARAFESEHRELAGAWDLSERAATQIERSIDELIGTSQLEEASSRLARLRELWPDRAGLAGRQQRIQGQRQSQDRWETLLRSIEETAETGRLREALEMFEGVDVPDRYGARFEQLQQRIREDFRAADQGAPSVTLASAADVEYRRNEPITIELLVRDDYGVVSVTLQARRARGQYQTIEVERVSAERYRAEIPVSVHENERNVEIWAEATDHSGHKTRIGSPTQPIEIRRGRGVRG